MQSQTQISNRLDYQKQRWDFGISDDIEHNGIIYISHGAMMMRRVLNPSSCSESSIDHVARAFFSSGRKWNNGSECKSTKEGPTIITQYTSSKKRPRIYRFPTAVATSNNTINDQDNATALVDDLLRNTRRLMGEMNNNESTTTIINQHVLAFSGGVDSSLVAALLKKLQMPHENVHAVLGISPAVPLDQIDLAYQIADHIGIEIQTVRTHEGDDETYIANDGQACFACKTHVSSFLFGSFRRSRSFAYYGFYSHNKFRCKIIFAYLFYGNTLYISVIFNIAGHL